MFFCNLAPNNEYLPIRLWRKKRLTRSNNRMIGGVCAGIADYFEWDITLVRIIYVLATFFTAFSGGLVYLILWLIMPEARRE